MIIELGILFTIIILILIAIKWIKVYNYFRSLHDKVKRELANISIVIKQRQTMYQALARVTSNYTSHESDTQVNTATSRSVSSGMLDLTVEAYPDLKASEVQKSLMGKDSISSIESRIRSHTELHNITAQQYNMHLHRFPTNIVGKFHNFIELEYVSFGENTYNDIKIGEK